MPYIGSTPTTQNFISGTDYFNGTGAQTAFTLTRTVNSVNDIQVVVNNVVQQPNDAYTLSGTTLTFTSAPSSGTNNVYVRYLSTTLQSITPSYGSIIPSMLNPPNTIYWNTSGNVGIGTSSPASKLDVRSGTSPNAANILIGLSGSNNYYDANTHIWQSGSSIERMRINSSGNVGIGTTNPSDRLDVLGADSSIASFAATNATTGYTTYKYNTSSTIGYIGNGSSLLSGAASTDFIFRSQGALVFASNGNNERMRIDSSGNVGIGFNAPAGILDIRSGSLPNRSLMIIGYTGISENYYDANTQIFRNGNSTEAMRISSSGNVSIGTTNQSARLTIASSGNNGIYSSVTGAYSAGYFTTNGGNSGVYGESNGYYGIYARTTTNSYGGLLAYDAPGTYYAILAYGGYSMYTNGSIYVNGTVYASDARLKENVVPISNALDKIKQLNPVSFDWKADSAKGIGNNNTPLPDYGMIAQEVEQVLPDLVHEATVPPKPKEDTTKLSLEDELGSCKGVDYSKLIPFLTKAIQEQQAMIEELKARIETLEAK